MSAPQTKSNREGAGNRPNLERVITTAKTTTSSEVKQRWINANYKRYGLSLRYDTDGEIIEYLDSNKDHDGKGVTHIIRAALKLYIKSNGG